MDLVAAKFPRMHFASISVDDVDELLTDIMSVCRPYLDKLITYLKSKLSCLKEF